MQSYREITSEEEIPTDEILNYIYYLQSDLREGKSTVPELHDRYERLYNRYPAVFNKVVEQGDKFDIQRYKEMLALRDKIWKGDASQYKTDQEMAIKLQSAHKKNLLQ